VVITDGESVEVIQLIFCEAYVSEVIFINKLGKNNRTTSGEIQNWFHTHS